MGPLLLLAWLAAAEPAPHVGRPHPLPPAADRPSPPRAGRGGAPTLSETSPGAARGKGGHSEHRASGSRTLYLASPVRPEAAEVLVQRPSGEVVAGELAQGEHGEAAWEVKVDTSPAGAGVDGVFGVHVVSRAVEGEVLVVRTAKYNLVNHSCGWGHPFRFDAERQRAKALPAAPLEIVGRGLWDDHFHVRTQAGDTLRFAVLRGGAPAPGARVVARTRSGWARELVADERGEVEVQLIRESWPERWALFDRGQRTPFVMTAELETPESGELDGLAYRRTRLVATLPWRYVPSRSEYTSYAWGLGVGLAAALMTAVAVLAWRLRRRGPGPSVVFDEAA